ncbi:MAG: hypothetical protein IPJ30_23080 [Acidobacteria bacterium]|nr:hypothetical protein [Acidobacteriota bacterium]
MSRRIAQAKRALLLILIHEIAHAAGQHQTFDHDEMNQAAKIVDEGVNDFEQFVTKHCEVDPICQNTTRGESQVAGISCLLAQTIILLFTMLCPAQSIPSESLEYVPLRTARNEIQQKKVLVSRPNRLEFEAADGRVIGEFSVSECDPNGWREHPGNIDVLSVAPKKRIAIDDVDLTGLVFTMSEGKRFYVNTRAGMNISFVRTQTDDIST